MISRSDPDIAGGIARARAAIFDMDGTLLDSMRFWRLVGFEYLVAHGLPLPEGNLSDLMRQPGTAMLTELFEALGSEFDRDVVVAELERRMIRRYREDVLAKPGVRDLLQALAQRGIPCAVATATPREIAAEALRRLNLDGYFRFITDGYEIGCGKHDPEFFRRVCDRLGQEPSQCWMFEDAAHAVRGAKAAGMHVCAVEDATAADRDEILRLSDVYVQDFTQLLPLLT